MRGKITQKLIEGLKPQEKPYEVRDTELRGFILRVQPTGAKTYICQYARGKRITLGASNIMVPYQARELAREALAKYITTGDAPIETRKTEECYTLESFVAEKYKQWVESNHRRPYDTLGLLASWYPVIGKEQLSEIKAWAVEKQRAIWLKEGAKPATVNHKITYLKVALNKAVAWGLLQSNPLTSVKRTKIDNKGVVRYLSDDEDARLRAALDARETAFREKRQRFNQWRLERGYAPFPDYRDGEFIDHLKPLVLLALNTGLRRGELFHLQWGDISFDRKMLTVHGQTAKSGKTRHVPLTDEAFAVLQGWYKAQSRKSGLVFPGMDGGILDNIKSAWTHLMKEAQIENFRFHDCRHTFASRLVMKGVDLNTVRELLGHSTIEMTLRYAHLAPEKLAAAIAVLNVK